MSTAARTRNTDGRQSGFSLIWDSAEFIAICVRRGYGLAPKAHVWLELFLTFFCGGSAAGAWMQREPSSTLSEGHRSAVSAVMAFFILLAYVSASPVAGFRELTTTAG